MQKTNQTPKLQAKKMKEMEEEYKQEDYPTDAFTKNETIDPKEYDHVEKMLQDAFGKGDYRSVLRCWNTMKKFEKAPSVSLSEVVESMQRFKKDTPFILRELKDFVKKFSSECDMSRINDLLESLAKRFDSELIEKIIEVLPSINLKMDAQSYEVLLNMYFTTRSFQDVKTLVSQMKASRIPFTTRSSMVVIKTSLKLSNFEEAVQHFRDFKSTWSTPSFSTTPSTAPSHVVSLLVDLACKERKLGEFLVELRGITLSDEVVNTMLLECVRQKDLILTSSVEKLAREQGVRFTDATYGLLIKGMATDPVRVQALFDEVVEKGVKVTSDFVGPMLAVCSQTSNVQMAEKLYTYMKPE